MNPIKTLFDETKDIYRTIEKVVTFGNLSEEALSKEIGEYVVTDKLRDNFETLLEALDAGLRDSSHEIGVWVSGFYGSGKSSFSKYIGLALDQKRTIDGKPLRDRLANRINSATIEPLLNSLVKKYDPVVFLIDLSAQQIGSYDLAPVGTIIYNEVMKWAGYPSEEKMALFERMLEMDGKLDTFKQTLRDEKDTDWDEVKHTNPLKAKAMAQNMAPVLYPQIWTDARSFQIMQIDSIESEQERMIKMLALIRKRTGHDNVIFIVDEVGQYISAKEDLILALQGTLHNLKDIGQGKAWLLATAQQTLTEDNANARYNSDKLYKLNDRFPIKIDIEASDIKEIATKRLLGKSVAGNSALKALYGQHGESLRIRTKLENAEKTIFKADLTEKDFIDLYPFLPNHFTLLLTLLGKLASRRGGIGLRSVIRVVQDVLIDRSHQPLAEMEVGTLATTVSIFNILRADIQKSYGYVVEAVDKVGSIYDDDSLEHHVAKSVAVLQIVDDFSLTVNNLAVMMHSSVSSPSLKDQVRQKVDELKGNRSLTLKEVDGQLRFMTDAILRIDDNKLHHIPTSNEVRQLLETQVQELFQRVPSAKVLEKTVNTGIQLAFDGRTRSVLEINETIQSQLHFEAPDSYNRTITELERLSTEKAAENTYYAVGQLDDSWVPDLEEIVRCEHIYKQRNQHEGKEIADYMEGQRQDADRLKQRLRQRMARALENGQLIFRGAAKTTKTHSTASYKDAMANCLKAVAGIVYHKFGQAPKNIESDAARKLLMYDDLKNLSEALNPFGLIKADGSIDTQAPALKSVEEFLKRDGQAEGKKVLDRFNEPEFGWSKDTTRYLVAVMFLSSMVKLRIGGEYVTVKGPTSIEKLSNATGFGQIGITLQTGDQPSNEQKKVAAQNLTALTGVSVLPLPQKISETVLKHFPDLKDKYAGLDIRLQTLGLPGADRIKSLQGSITEILKGDASDATFRLGKADASLYLDLQWAKKVRECLENKATEKTVKALREIQISVQTLPNVPIIEQLRTEVAGQLGIADQMLGVDEFYDKIPDLKDTLGMVQQSIELACQQFEQTENARLDKAIADVRNRPAYSQLTDEQHDEIDQRLSKAQITNKSGIQGIQDIVNEGYQLQTQLSNLHTEMDQMATDNNIAPPPPNPLPYPDPDKNPQVVAEPRMPLLKMRTVRLAHLPRKITKIEDLDQIITELQSLKNGLTDGEVIELIW
ncbi:BREX system P-loop protein BrxC [Dyadobacter chenhuakuii]|uniref:BREX system P-loop protein BrxC n=1 Tax=Dyadobacter chenhuakuii TaxID=2909339 RepID=A0ABY4XMC3_9BACT|nr:BREX system P-loop protein BrxC [Dyadobacter chenhuakuii]MCF2494278.1 BREX system P-loop protein BrxC [Dyadobacter chenhuakuii]USJ31403.1 BREX system P-loop protein BrxC [Dyadobacter chenhuakuii]